MSTRDSPRPGKLSAIGPHDVCGRLPDARLKDGQGSRRAERAGDQSEAAEGAPKPPVKPPAWFLAAIKKNRKALTAWKAFSPSHKREYIEWVTEAKTDATRDRRLAQAIEWIAEGKPRNWKYM